MCGITGMIHLEQDLRQQEALLRKMQETLRRRGPDQEGIFLSPRCAMAHTRLAVIDVEKLLGGGGGFQTHCDTEVVLQSYAHWGHAVWNSATAFSPLPSGNTPPSGSFWHVTASA